MDKFIKKYMEHYPPGKWDYGSTMFHVLFNELEALGYAPYPRDVKAKIEQLLNENSPLN